MCGSRVWPTLKRTANRIISSLSLNLIAVIYGTITKSPDRGDEGDRIRLRALWTSEESFEEKSASWLSTIRPSHTFCMCLDLGGDTGTLKTGLCNRSIIIIIIIIIIILFIFYFFYFSPLSTKLEA